MDKKELEKIDDHYDDDYDDDGGGVIGCQLKLILENE